ncbi:Hypothetical predicted protein [Paramuricea clavata]|uniref:Uncharacterized protein n=1 Tax=Paramuricea clavata TaxID=317549 RepID=A0A6S7JB88_PARCT|nr:Hypothetical predicted protein [Paramuricea clavata]
MSDVFKKNYVFKRYNRDVVVDNNHCLQYVKKQCINSEEIIFTLHITNEVLKSWEDFKGKGISLNFSFVEILNYFLAEKYAILVKKDCKRIEEGLRKLCSKVKSGFKGKSGLHYVNFASQSRSFAIQAREILRASDLEIELCKLNTAKVALEKENAALQKRCDDLYSSLVQEEELRRKTNDSLEDAKVDLQKLEKENANLCKYFDKISELEGFKNCGKPFSEVKGRQQRRKIRELKTYVEQALWFAETFGLKLSSVKFNNDEGVSHTIDYTIEDRKKGYKDLSEEEKEKVQQVLYITDSFCIGEAAYHEFTMTEGGEKLPRSYLVKQCKNYLNSLCHITRTPGVAEGAQMNLESELRNTIKQQASFYYYL